MRPTFEPGDPDYRQRVVDSFAQQGAMATLGISLLDLGPGWTELGLTRTDAVSQQHGFVHAGALTTAMDSACGYAAFSLMPADAEVLTVEFKVNLLNPARHDNYIARGWVVKHGRTLTVSQSECVPTDDSGPPVAMMTATLMTLRRS